MQYSIKTLTALIRRIQSVVARGVIKRVNAAGNLQTVQAELLKTEVRELEHFEPYGFTAKALDGAECAVVFPGASRGHGIAIAVCDRRYRLTGLADGEVAIYNDKGTQVILRSDGSVEINASGGVQINGDLTVSGNVSDSNGSMQSMRTTFNTHAHPGDSGGSTGAPYQWM